MSRNLAPGLMTLLGRRDKSIKSHTTLEMVVDTTDVKKSYYFATSALTFNNIEWLPLVKQGSQIRSSLTRASDSATIELHNADTLVGRELLALKQSLYGAAVKVGRLWRDNISAAEYHEIFLTGVVVSLSVGEEVARLTAVSEPYAQVSVGASRRVVPSCQWEFRSVLTCGYAGSELSCNFLLNDPGGCEGRHGSPLKQAKFGGMAYQNSGSRFKTI